MDATHAAAHIADSAITLTQFMQPEHSNSLGTIHGGVILKLCDEARRHRRQPPRAAAGRHRDCGQRDLSPAGAGGPACSWFTQS